MSKGKRGTPNPATSGPAPAADDDVWVGVEEALGMAREAGLGEEALLVALRRGEVRARGYYVPTEDEAKRTAAVAPVPLATEFWRTQSDTRRLWENSGIRDFGVEAELQRPSVERWIDEDVRRLMLENSTHRPGKGGRPSAGPFLRALHERRWAMGADLAIQEKEATALVAVQRRADRGDRLLGPVPDAIHHVVKLVFG